MMPKKKEEKVELTYNWKVKLYGPRSATVLNVNEVINCIRYSRVRNVKKEDFT